MRNAIGFILLAATFAGCSPLNRTVSETDLVKAGRHEIIEGIHAPEIDGVRGCGAQALAAAMAFVDPSQSAAALASELPWRDFGATPVDLLIEARRRGFAATIERGSMERMTALAEARQPALVMIDAGLKVRSIFAMFGLPPKLMHWAVVSGVGHDGSEVLLAAENHRHHIASRTDFLTRWSQSDCCMIVVHKP